MGCLDLISTTKVRRMRNRKKFAFSCPNRIAGSVGNDRQHRQRLHGHLASLLNEQGAADGIHAGLLGTRSQDAGPGGVGTFQRRNGSETPERCPVRHGGCTPIDFQIFGAQIIQHQAFRRPGDGVLPDSAHPWKQDSPVRPPGSPGCQIPPTTVRTDKFGSAPKHHNRTTIVVTRVSPHGCRP